MYWPTSPDSLFAQKSFPTTIRNSDPTICFHIILQHPIESKPEAFNGASKWIMATVICSILYVFLFVQCLGLIQWFAFLADTVRLSTCTKLRTCAVVCNTRSFVLYVGDIICGCSTNKTEC